MNAATRNLTEQRNFYTETTGNVTRIFFGAQPAAPSESVRYDGESISPDSVSAPQVTDKSQTPRQKELAVPNHAANAALTGTGIHQTPRQKELAVPDTKDMATQPLEHYDQVKALLDYFDRKLQYRESCLLVFGFCTGLRISDLVSLKIGDVLASTEPIAFKACIDIREQKTGKRTVGHLDDMLITPAMQTYFTRYFQTLRCREFDNYLFSSRQSYGKTPMSIRQLQRALTPAFAAVCPHLHCATHTMRKTFVAIIHTFAEQSHVSGGGLNPTTVCQVALRHANASTTLAYMGTVKAGMLSLRRAVSDFVLGRTKIKSLQVTYQWELEDD